MIPIIRIESPGLALGFFLFLLAILCTNILVYQYLFVYLDIQNNTQKTKKMRVQENLRKAIENEIDSLIWAAKEFANEIVDKSDFKVLVKGSEVAILFDDGNDGHSYEFDEESGKLEAIEFNYYDSDCTRGELEDFDEVEF